MQIFIFFNKVILSSCLILFVHCQLLGQVDIEVGKHDKKTHKDEQGDIYWNLGLPVYINLSTSPNQSGYTLTTVKREKMKEFANPMYFDGHGVHYIKHNDYENPVPEHEISFPIYVDGMSPKSKLYLNNAASYKGLKQFYGKGLKLSIVVKDEMSGVDQTFYSIGNAPFQNYSTELTLLKEKDYVFNYYSVDKVGNVEEVNNRTFYVDITSPVSTFEISKDRLGDIYSPRSVLKLIATDNASGVKNIRMSFDKENESNYLTPSEFSKLNEGHHTLYYYSIDRVKNVESKHKYEFYLDKTPPEVYSEVKGDYYQNNGKTYFSDRSQLIINAKDNKAGLSDIFFSLNRGKRQDYKTPLNIIGNEGINNIRFQAVDKVNNSTAMIADETIGKGTIYLDKTPPIINNSFNGPKILDRDTTFITGQTNIVLSANDLLSGVKEISYRIYSNPEVEYKAPFKVSKDGYHSVTMKGLDNVNNESSKSFSFVVDNKGPEIFSNFSIENIGIQKLIDRNVSFPIYPKGVLLYLAATDEMVGTSKILYTIDGKGKKSYTGPITMNITGVRTITISAIDKLGNVAEGKRLEFVIQ